MVSITFLFKCWSRSQRFEVGQLESSVTWYEGQTLKFIIRKGTYLKIVTHKVSFYDEKLVMRLFA